MPSESELRQRAHAPRRRPGPGMTPGAGREPGAPVAAEVPVGAVEHDALADALARAIRGDVHFDAGTRAIYATDASNYRHPPIGVVLPRDADDVARVVSICRAHGAPVLGRGAGTSLSGQTCNRGVVL